MVYKKPTDAKILEIARGRPVGPAEILDVCGGTVSPPEVRRGRRDAIRRIVKRLERAGDLTKVGDRWEAADAPDVYDPHGTLDGAPVLPPPKIRGPLNPIPPEAPSSDSLWIAAIKLNGGKASPALELAYFAGKAAN